jgi:L-threonylcarbamoyladenylate synthase
VTGSIPPQTRMMRFDDAAIAAAAKIIAAGGCVAVPTETVYGLAADATDGAAVAGIYAAKGRPSFNPLIVHVTDRTMAERLGELDSIAARLTDAFWPGPLTIVVPRRADCPVASIATAGLETIALRCPAHRAMQALIAASGKPLAAPSANASGGVSPTTAAHVLASLGGRVPLVIDAGPCTAGLESTIVRPMSDRLMLLRPGPVTAEMLTAASGLPVVADESGAISAPGQLASHYAPGKPVLLDCVAPPTDAFVIGFGSGVCDYQLSALGSQTEAAARLFDALHAGAASVKPRIAVAPIPHEGLGVAINDRLHRAAA